MPGSSQDSLTSNATSNIRSKRIVGPGSVEVFFDIPPPSTRDDERGQFFSMVARAYEALSSEGLTPSNVVCGWVRFAKEPTWSWREVLASSWAASGPLPITGVIQPPVEPSCYCSMQLQAVRAARQSGVWHGSTSRPSAATILRSGARHLRLMSVTPRPDLMGRATMLDLAYDMFAQAGHALTARGLSFRDVVRTWIHLRDIETHYAALNEARNRFTAEQGLTRLPASTCVEATFLGAFTPVAMDLYAVSASPESIVSAISTTSMNEAPSYGSAFARASLLEESFRRTLFVSGTASIDTQGNVVGPSDLEAQLACMLDNVRGLLHHANLDFADTLSATVYLKRAEYAAACRSAAMRAGLSAHVPAALVVADICRPDWLCEMELIAARNRA
jgi:enamine deaminase RidA (YjgF/YER057c/UK114 family)